MRLRNIIGRLAAAALAFACLARLAPGCGPSTAVPPMDGGARDASPPNNEGDQIFPAATEQVVATSKGGFVPPAPDGSTCQRVDTTYTLLSTSRTLTWTICDATDDAGHLGFVMGERILTEDEYAPLVRALEALTPGAQQGCGADKPELAVTFVTPSGATTYYDDFYFCRDDDARMYVGGLDDVFGELAKLATLTE